MRLVESRERGSRGLLLRELMLDLHMRIRIWECGLRSEFQHRRF